MNVYLDSIKNNFCISSIYVIIAHKHTLRRANAKNISQLFIFLVVDLDLDLDRV